MTSRDPQNGLFYPIPDPAHPRDDTDPLSLGGSKEGDDASGATESERSVTAWLGVIYLSVLGMIVLGGLTRLTDSGLSMVDWHPLTGVLPPTGEEAWQAAFSRYKTSRQFQLVNHWMTVADFREIFLWEYLHRLAGRAVGVLAMVPWVILVAKGRLRGRLARRTALLPLGVAAQGVLGWYMVRSGLIDVPQVSHFRLAAHLVLAFGIGHWALWLLFSQYPAPSSRRPCISAWGFVGLLALQVTYGAFMAGTHAGWFAPTFPDMNGHYLPGSFWSSAGLLWDMVFNPAIIHYVHRVLAALIAVCGLGLLWLGLRAGVSRRVLAAMGMLLGLQLVLGVLTVVLSVPIDIAVTHQVTSYLLFGSALAVARALSTRPVPLADSHGANSVTTLLHPAP